MTERREPRQVRKEATVAIDFGVSGNRAITNALGAVTERLKVHDWKSCVPNKHRGFESPPLRQSLCDWRSRAGFRGAGAGRRPATAASNPLSFSGAFSRAGFRGAGLGARDRGVE
jgi:hypothetical protein